MFWDKLDDEWAHWQMLDRENHDVLNRAKDRGDTEAEILHLPKFSNPWKYAVDLVTMTQQRMLNGEAKGSVRQLQQVQLVIVGATSGAWAKQAVAQGYELHWQYLGDTQVGWKNFEPTPNDECLAAWREGREAQVTHVWANYRHGVQRDKYTVNFQSLKQKATQGRRTERDVRLVAWKTASRWLSYQ